MEQVKNKKKGITIAGISAIVLIVTLSISFAYWAYSRTTDNQILVAGDIFMKYTETNQLVIKNALPSKEPGENDYFEFKITGKNTYNKPIWYEIVLNHGVENPEGKTERLLDKFLMFRLVETKDGVDTTVVDNASYEDITNKKIWVNTIPAGTKDNIEITYKLYMWISFDTRIGNTEGDNYDMETWNNQVYASVRVSVNGDFEEKSLLPESVKKVLSKAEEKQECNPIIEDEDGTIYFSGDNTCIDFNYVWYSGKLWRIISINSDGTMKMIAQDVITTINWGEDTTYKDKNKASWIYQWLNEDFKDTLYNYENIIVQNADWNATETSSITVKPTTDDSADIVGGDVGSLNSYEYYQSYKNTTQSKGYLIIDYAWWLITPDMESNVRNVSNNGNFGSNSPSSDAYGVRPSINLKSNIQLNGEGTKSNPYTITIDKATGKSGELINTRISGEYVRVDGKVYRIVGIEEGTTKLTSVDYVRDDGGTILDKNFGSKNSWVTSVSNDSDDKYWSYYLNNTWITPELEKYITEGTYYLGKVGEKVSYKNSICSTSNTSETTSSCAKTSDTWTGKVGLPRLGEMFSAQLGEGSSTSSNMWSITPFLSTHVWYIYGKNITNHDWPSTKTMSARPSINLKSSVKITLGDGMTPKTAYEVGL